MEKHVGIMLYFDNFHRVESLPDDQLGLLFRALMACGEAELAGRDGITGFETRYPAMGERAQMAFAFMADNIRRDADTYHAKSANLRAAARLREERKRAARSPERPEVPRKPEDGEPSVPAPAAIREKLEELTRGMRMERGECGDRR